MGEEAREAGDKARETEREIRVALGEARSALSLSNQPEIYLDSRLIALVLS